MKVLEKAEKGQGLALKLSSLGRVKYQQHMKHTHAGIGISPFLIVKYRTIYLFFLRYYSDIDINYISFYKNVKLLYLVCQIVMPLYLAYL